MSDAYYEKLYLEIQNQRTILNLQNYGNTVHSKVYILMSCSVQDTVANCSTVANCVGFVHFLCFVDSPGEEITVLSGDECH
jgi:hypothetical protein